VNGGAVRHRDLVGRIDRLEVRCRCCDRYGRLRLAKLIEKHGPDTGLPKLAVQLASGCAKAGLVNPAERCSVVFPQMPMLFPG
jgi:hypothetical protein